MSVTTESELPDQISVEVDAQVLDSEKSFHTRLVRQIRANLDRIDELFCDCALRRLDVGYGPDFLTPEPVHDWEQVKAFDALYDKTDCRDIYFFSDVGWEGSTAEFVIGHLHIGGETLRLEYHEIPETLVTGPVVALEIPVTQPETTYELTAIENGIFGLGKILSASNPNRARLITPDNYSGLARMPNVPDAQSE